MNYNALIKNQTYLFESEKDEFIDNNDIIYKICEDAKLEKPSKIQFITSEINFDLYKISINNLNLIIKFSLNELDSSLKKEYNIIKNINKSIRYEPIFFNTFKYGDFIHYSIYLDENFECIKDFGLGILSEKKDLFVESYFLLQNYSKPKANHKENILEFINEHSMSFFDKDTIESIQESLDIEKLKEIINSIHSEIFLLFNSEVFDKDEFCHGNLNYNNIFYCYKNFKFFNLSNAFTGNMYCDLANLVITSSLNKELEKKIFNLFVKYKNTQLIAEEWIQYRKCYDLISRKIFLELLFLFLKEIYLFSSRRPIKLLQIIEIFSQNQNNFLKIPTVNKNYEFIYNTLLQPLIGNEELFH
jgi:hypothetical protein